MVLEGQMDIHHHIIKPSVFRSLPAHMDVQGGVHALVCPHLYPYGNYGEFSMGAKTLKNHPFELVLSAICACIPRHSCDLQDNPLLSKNQNFAY